MYRSSGNCKTRKTQRRLIDSNIGDANRSDVRRGSAEPDNPTFRSFGLHCPSRERGGFTCFTFGLDIVLRHSALRAYETFKTSRKANWPVSTKYIPS